MSPATDRKSKCRAAEIVILPFMSPRTLATTASAILEREALPNTNLFLVISVLVLAYGYLRMPATTSKTLFALRTPGTESVQLT